jgi:hypothetical protein
MRECHGEESFLKINIHAAVQEISGSLEAKGTIL